MNKRTTLCLIAMSLSFATALLGGCAPTSSAPFHMYSSPLLEGEMRAQNPRVRTYAPFDNIGDHKAKPRDAGVANAGANAPPPARKTQPAAPPLAAARPAPKAVGSSQQVGAQSARPQSAAPTKPATAVPTTPASKTADVEARHTSLAASFVHAIYTLNGVAMPESAKSSVPEIYKTCRSSGKIYHSSRPTIGDVVFFHNTFDANGDGRNNDWYTHVALVEEIQSNGTVNLLGYGGSKVERFQMNLEHVDSGTLSNGKTVNSQLRAANDDDPPFTQHLSSQLFAGFCSLLGEQSDFMVVDNWQPGMNLNP